MSYGRFSLILSNFPLDINKSIVYNLVVNMTKKQPSLINYQKLLTSIVKEKYFSLLLGMFVSYVIASNLLKFLPKNIIFRLPTFAKKTAPTSPKSQIALKIYTVSEGDDLWHIAEKFYGSGFNAYDISVANNLDPSTTINAGQRLIIPQVTRRQQTVGDIYSGASTSQVTYTEGKYVVQPGDSLSIIAQKVYGDLYAWPRLLQANKLISPDIIEIGMILTIPR